jgi:nucleoside-diphosphate-sugar epimerase
MNANVWNVALGAQVGIDRAPILVPSVFICVHLRSSAVKIRGPDFIFLRITCTLCFDLRSSAAILHSYRTDSFFAPIYLLCYLRIGIHGGRIDQQPTASRYSDAAFAQVFTWRRGSMRVVVIGGTGHIGSYLVPRLVASGHDVISISRGLRDPYQSHPAWHSVRQLTMDRSVEESNGTFAGRIRDLQPDVVMDLICFSPDYASHLVDALKGRVQHFLHCGTIWVHGHTVQSPVQEAQSRHPFGEYGIQKAAIEKYLLDAARLEGFPATVIHPGHIVGPGWLPVNPAGNFNPAVFARIARGEELALPNFGMETVHHVHADDVAQVFVQAMANRNQAIGESFHAVSPAAVTLRGFAEEVATWFNQPSRLRFMPWDQWQATVTEQDAEATLDHISHSPNCSIAKAVRLLQYTPRYTSFQAVFEAVMWLVDHKVVVI